MASQKVQLLHETVAVFYPKFVLRVLSTNTGEELLLCIGDEELQYLILLVLVRRVLLREAFYVLEYTGVQ